MKQKISGPFKLPLNGNQPDKMVILLHGVGANGQDLISLAEDLTEGLENAVFLSPNAPFEYDMFPEGYQWFSLKNRDEEVLYDEIQKTLPILKDYVEENLKKYKLTYKDLILVGFSQGTMMAIHFALSLNDPCLAVIGFSGTLVNAERLSKNIHSKPPFFLAHGSEDQVITISAHKATVTALKDNDLNVEDHVIKNLGHGINFKGVQLANNFLKNR